MRKAVGNWLNDASKTRPDWTRAVCRRWTKESRTAETRAIVRRALRTLDGPRTPSISPREGGATSAGTSRRSSPRPR